MAFSRLTEAKDTLRAYCTSAFTVRTLQDQHADAPSGVWPCRPGWDANAIHEALVRVEHKVRAPTFIVARAEVRGLATYRCESHPHYELKPSSSIFESF